MNDHQADAHQIMRYFKSDVHNNYNIDFNSMGFVPRFIYNIDIYILQTNVLSIFDSINQPIK